LAQMSRLFHTQATLLNRKIAQAVATNGVDGLLQAKEEIDQLIAVSARAQSLAKEIHRGRESTIAEAVACRVISQSSSPCLLGSR
jgi:hypothetical protein